MSNPAFIVDGQMEQLAIQRICPGRPVRLLGCNGKDVSYEAAAKRASSLIRLMKNYRPVIIIFDRETREDTHEVVAKQLKAEIMKQNINGIEVIIGVPDRMMENWILSEGESARNHLGKDVPAGSHQGKNGKSIIKSMTPPEKSYSETEDGSAMLYKCDSDKISCPSFLAFKVKLKNFPCRWLKNNLLTQQDDAPEPATNAHPALPAPPAPAR